MAHAILPLLRNAGAFLAAAWVVGAAINSRLPTTPVFGLAQKLDYLATHPEIDTVFVGSSRVFHAFDPLQFDREMARRGRPTHSFNLGLDGMRPPESYYVLREVLKNRRPLRRMLVELVDIFPAANVANLGSARYHHWHDWRHTQLVLQQVLASRETFVDQLSQGAVHLACFVIRTSNVGRGAAPTDHLLLARGPIKTMPNPWTENRGFIAQTKPLFAGPKRAGFERAVANIQAHGLGTVAMPGVCAQAIRELISEIHASGAEPIFVLSPTISRAENFTNFAAVGIDAPLIAFDDPQKYPAIFDPENHCDAEHLNASGAAEFTRALAEEFAAQR